MDIPRIEDTLVSLGTTVDDFRRWLDALEVGIVVQATDSTILASNAAASAILMLSPDEIAGRTSFDPRWRAIREDGSPFPGEDHPGVVALRTGAPVRDVIMGLRFADADTRWIKINSHPVSNGAQSVVSASVTTFVDVTAERLAVELDQLRLALKQVAFTSVRSLLGLEGEALTAGIEDALGAVAEVIGADRAYVMQSPEPGAELSCTHEWCAAGIAPFHRTRSPLSGDRYARLVAWAGAFDVVDLPNEQNWPETSHQQQAMLEERTMAQLRFLPMKTASGVVGFLGFERRVRKPWPADIDSALRAFVDGVTSVLELVRSEARRRAEQARYQLLAEENPAGIVELDVDGICRYANPQYAAMLGRTPADVVGREGVLDVHPLDRAEARERVMTVLATGRAINGELRLLHADGHAVWAQVNGIRLTDERGRPAGLLGTAVDITEQHQAQEALRRSEERFRSLVQHASDIFSVLEADGSWRYSSPAGKELLGWPEGTDPPGGILSLVHPDDAALAATTFGEVIAGTRGPSEPVTFRVRASDGSYRVFETSGQNLLDDPAVHGVLLISRDVTAREEVREQLTRARDAAVETLQARSEFIAIVSHELRTPMHAVLGLSELLSSSDLDFEQRRYVDSIRRSVQSLSTIVDDILDYSRGEAGRLALHPVTFNLAGVVSDVIALFGTNAATKGLVLGSTIDDSVPFLVSGDPDRIRQILVNLVANAIKYTDAGSVEVRVGATPLDAEHVAVELSVRDTGIGISPEAQTRLFDPFVQGEGATQRRYGGTGLGLAICRQLVELMHGTLTVNSALGHGSEFIARIELETADRPRMTVRVTMPAGSAQMAPERHVLIVEDDEVNQLLADRQLAELGIHSTVVPDGLTALRYFAEHTWDAVLLDVQLPGMDGLEVARRLRSTATTSAGARVPIIAMTASAMAGDRDACIAAGMDDYLAKPVGLDALRATLAHWFPELETAPAFAGGASPTSLDALSNELGGDRATVQRMATVFLTELDRRRSAITAAADTESFVAAVHALGSAAAALSLTGLFAACRAAEQAARKGQPFDRVTHEQAIHRAIARSQTQLERWLAETAMS